MLSLRQDRSLYNERAWSPTASNGFPAGVLADDCSSSIYSCNVEDEESLRKPATAVPSDSSSGADEGSQQVREDEEASAAHGDRADDHMQNSGLGIHCPHFSPNPRLKMSRSNTNNHLRNNTHKSKNHIENPITSTMKQISSADSVLDLNTHDLNTQCGSVQSTASTMVPETDEDDLQQLTGLETFSTDALLAELARRQPKDDSQEWAEIETPRGAWAFPNEAGLSETALACAELAATGARRMGLCPATMNGEDTEEFEVEALRRKIDAIKCTLRKSTEGCHRVIRPTLYTDIGLDGLIAELIVLTTALRDQRRPQALIDGTVKPKPQRHPKELPNTETIWVDTKKGVAEMVDTIMDWVDFLTTSTHGTPFVAKDEPLLAIDIEGVQLGRHGGKQ